MPVIVLTTLLPAAPEVAFELSLDVDVHARSMAGFGERVAAATRPGPLGHGDTVTFAARHFGLPWRMTSRITEYERPRRFVDEQVSGPFRSWRHEHVFRWDDERGVTEARDEVHYTAPLGPLGRLVSRFVLQRHLVRILTERNTYLARASAESDKQRR